MKRICYVFGACLFVLLTLFGCSSDDVTVKEEGVRISINAQVAPPSAIISNEKNALVVDPKRVTSLYISSPTNSDLEALKHFVKLKYLRIDNYAAKDEYAILDLNSIRALPLVALSIAGSDSTNPIPIKSLEPIGNIKSLVILDLEYCQVTSVKDLAGLTGLRRLYIKDGNDIKIEDLLSLSDLTKLGEASDSIEELKEWEYGPNLAGDEPILGLLIYNGNSQEEIEGVEAAILANKGGSVQEVAKEDEPENPTETIAKSEGKEDLYYFIEYSTYKSDSKGGIVNIFLEAHDIDGNLIWDYSWYNIRPTELNVASETVSYDGKVYKEVGGILYCLDGTSGEKHWENDVDVGGGAIIYPFKGRIYLTSYYGNVLTCLDKDSGDKIWAIEDQDKYWGHLIYSKDDEIIVGYGEVELLSVHYEDGRILKQWNGDERPSDLSIRWDRASASSVLDGNDAGYGAMNVIDRNAQTAWVEGAAGHGIGEWIQIERDAPADIARIEISNGYHKSSDLYRKNGKLKRFRLDFSDGQYIYYEVDPNKEDGYRIHIDFNRPISTNFIKLTILDAFEGSRYEDTCITDIVAYSSR